MKKWFKKYWWIVLLLVLALGFVVKSRGTDIEVDTAVAAKKSISRSVLSSGELRVDDAGQVYSPTTGVVEVVLVKEGEAVVKGQAIARLDAGATTSGLAQARASLAQAQQAQSALLDTYLTETKKQALKAAMDNAGDARTRAQRNYNDDNSDTNKASLEAAINAHEQAEANYEAAQDSQPTPADLEAAATAVQAAQSAYNEANRSLGKTTVVAPTDGVISFTRDQVAEVTGAGRAVTAGQLLATIYTPASLYFEVEVDETTIPLITLGLATKVELDAFLGASFTATVVEISGRPVVNSNGSDVYLVQVKVDGANNGFREGMQGQAEFILETADEVVVVPAAAVIVQDETDAVFILRDDSTVERRTVEVGVESATETQIVSGVEVGERVITSSNVRDLKDGQAVKLSSQ